MKITSDQNLSGHTTENAAEKNQPDDGLQDLNLPIPIQTFLWRQVQPFIRPKLGKLHEASCMVSNILIFE